MRFFATPRGRDLLIAALLFALPLVLFAPQTIGGRTLIPAENLYQFQPYAADREALGVPAVPHNHLVSDLVLQNVQWKSFTRAELSRGELPLWNPHQFSGIAFFAAGQQSTLYPFSVLYYVLPLSAAYGWFTVVQLWLAGLFMYAFMRGIGVGRFGGAAAGVTYQLSAFFAIGAVFPMIIASAVWLPLILLMIERLIDQPRQTPLWIATGAAAVGCNILAGHVEITYYTLLIAGCYAAIRLGMRLFTPAAAGETRWMAALQRGAAMLVMVAIGVGIGAVQFVPLFQAAANNFRSDGTTFDQVLGWAHPLRDVVQFALPNFYGNPSHHTIFDVFTLQQVPVTVNALGEARAHTEWGIKNYVEAALYVGILPLILAAFGLAAHNPRKWIFAGLGLFAFTVMFGLPTYAILYFTLPGIDQLHSPFRWVFALTLCVAALAGLGADHLASRAHDPAFMRRVRRIGAALCAAGLGIGLGLVASRLLYEQVTAGIVERIFNGMALATSAFPDARAFYSYQFVNIALFAAALAASGVVLAWAGRAHASTRRAWEPFAVGVIALDLIIASFSFNPASDPAWLDYTPPSIAWLQQQPGEWRYITLDDPTAPHPQLFNANMTLRYGLDDVRGYESIIPKPYVDAMRAIAPQVQTDFNRVAPLYTVYPPDIAFDAFDALRDGRLNPLNVRYVITHTTTDLSEIDGYALAYQDEAVRIWENAGAFGRIFAVDTESVSADPTLTSMSAREFTFDVTTNAAGAALTISQSYDAGWRAFVRPASSDAETEIPVMMADGALTAVTIPGAGAYSVRMVYSPQSVVIGAVISALSGMIALLLCGVWLWRRFVVPPGAPGIDQNAPESGVRVIARNSITPVILNLFNRGVDMAFALVMLRVLGPGDAGLYYYAGVVFVWFDIFTNFGLNLYLIREAARERARAAYLFINTSALRVLLVGAGVPLLIGFLSVRQNAPDPLPADAVLSIALLYIGLLPNSLSNGLSALFYAYERAEIPAATATAATILKTAGQLTALVLGFGIVGLAAVSIVVNIVTLAVLWWQSPLRRANGTQRHERAAQGRSASPRIDRGLMRRMVGESYPLMLNHFLATIFFQIDIVLIEWIHNPTMVGQYSVAYKWVAALNVIPSFFTQALLPSMSRQAHDDPAALKRTVTMALKLLMAVALPTAVVFTFTAFALAGLLGGAEYLPEGGIATQIMIWSIPIGWMNSLMQYVLIAFDLQRRITRAFAAAVGFNVIANLIFIPAYGYQAAAITTILSEGVLLIAFSILLRRAFGWIDWRAVAWKPALAAAAMFGVLAVGFTVLPIPALIVSALVYGGVLAALRPFSAAEIARLAPLMPGRVRRWVLRPESAGAAS
ncbi:MAG: oligosaccharide flippase family protein [bacterium]|nr:oligosaccharide flippase family protein [bacterium]